nr:MAG TPA: hypothetical protein [Caudoviricetes sp.]
MIDSVLKGTGNSRFLKSAVPAGTSWADALAMLQAGTFPIDFNGINTEGFQQVGTPLNKANLLKDATAAQIGLPPSTTPDGMFQALGNTGELHVWRKTVTTAQEIPAGYTLGSVISTWLVHSGDKTDYWNCTIATGVTVDDAGNITFTGITGYSPKTEMSSSNYTTLANETRGKFVRFNKTAYVTADETWYYVPQDATFYFEEATGSYVTGERYSIKCDKLQTVTGYPLTPAGTTTTYPVSTNPNAYQEGDDTKAAGYVVGEVKTDKKVVSALSNGGNTVYWTFSNTLTVADDGTISLANGTTLSLRALDSDAVSNAQPLIGKYACFSSMGTETTGTDFPLNQVIFFPSDTTFTMVSKVENGINKNTIQASKYQPVTGYPAIPAGTTIEYLGKLGDKAQVQVVSYVGTGVSGIGHKNSLTFDFAPKVVIISSTYKSGYSYAAIIIPGIKNGVALSAYQGGQSRTGFAIISEITEKTVNWYSDVYTDAQMNTSGTKYMAVAIG